MKTFFNTKIVTPKGKKAIKGTDMQNLVTIEDGMVVVGDDGIIDYVGTRNDAQCQGETVDLGGRVLLPGFVDSHTHAVFGGFRPDEFRMRLEGLSYMDIMNAGGGIQSTVDATRKASADELLHSLDFFIRRMSEAGVTTVEIKSGYGLDTATERKMLEVIAQAKERYAGRIGIESTFLGAHAVPREYAGRTAEYTDLIINEMLPEFRGLASNCDVFCERGVFELDDSRRLMEAARALGYNVKFHADEIVQLGGAELAASLGALSADHLLHVSDEGIRALAASGTVATCLPPTAFALREPYAPARKMIDAGCAVALATDLNPGSCFSGSIPLTIALACIYMNMSVEETVTALTLNGAAALGIASRVGSIEPGKEANFAVLAFDSINFLPYYVAMNCVESTYYKGQKIIVD